MKLLRKYIKQLGQNVGLGKWIVIEEWEHDGENVIAVTDFTTYYDASAFYHDPYNGKITLLDFNYWKSFWDTNPNIKKQCVDLKIIPCD